MHRKGLVVGIIVLFLGVSIQPSMGTRILEEREVETNDNIQDCQPCKLRELLGDDAIKMIELEFSNINNKFRGNTEDTPICRILIYIVQSYYWYAVSMGLIAKYFEMFAPSIYLKFENMFNSMMDNIIEKLTDLCYRYEDVHECGQLIICGFK